MKQLPSEGPVLPLLLKTVTPLRKIVLPSLIKSHSLPSPMAISLHLLLLFQLSQMLVRAVPEKKSSMPLLSKPSPARKGEGLSESLLLQVASEPRLPTYLLPIQSDCLGWDLLHFPLPPVLSADRKVHLRSTV